MNFIDTGLDERILKSLDVENPSENLIKAMNKQGLVQKEVQVRGKNGKMFTRKQWVKAGEDQPTQNQTGGHEGSKSNKPKGKKESETFKVGDKVQFKSGGRTHTGVIERDVSDSVGKPTYVVNTGTMGIRVGAKELTMQESNTGGAEVSKEKTTIPAAGGSGGGDDGGNKVSGKGKTVNRHQWVNAGSQQEAKSQIAQALASGKSRDDLMNEFKSMGVTWKENDHDGINWMRAAMAMNKHLTSGAVNSQTDATGTSQGSEGNNKSDEKNTEKKFENGYIDKDGDLVVDDKSDLEELVSEITGTNSFDQKDLALEELEKNPEYKGAFIEEMGIDKASQNKDGSISVTAYVEGYTEIDTDDGDIENFETYVTFDIPVTQGLNSSQEKNASKYETTMKEFEDKEKSWNTPNTKSDDPAHYQDEKVMSTSGSVASSMFMHDIADVNDIDGTNKRLKKLADSTGITKNGGKLEMDSKGRVMATASDGTSKKLYVSNPDGTGSITSPKNEGEFFMSRGLSFEPKVSKKLKSEGMKANKSVIGADYTQLTTEKESGTIEGEAHNMMVGRLGSQGKKKPTEKEIKDAANFLKDAAIKRVISSYNQDELVHQLAMAKQFTKLAGGNMDHMTLERTYKDVISGSSYTQEQKCDAMSKLLGSNYTTTNNDTVARYSNYTDAAVHIRPLSRGNFEVTFTYGDGAGSTKETYDSIDSVKKAADKWIDKEDNYYKKDKYKQKK